MHCDTSTRPIINLLHHKHARAVHAEVLRFVRGIRGPRRNPVTRTQIGAWLARTPGEAVDAALVDLIAEGKVGAEPLSLRSRNSAKRATGYWATVTETASGCSSVPNQPIPAIITPMDATAYRDQIARLGLSQESAARVCGVNGRTSRRWALDERAVPGTVERLLWACEQYPELIATFLDKARWPDAAPEPAAD